MTINHINKSAVITDVKKQDFVQFMYHGKSRTGIVELVQRNRPIICRTSVDRDYITIEHLNPASMDDKRYSTYTIDKIESNVLIQSD